MDENDDDKKHPRFPGRKANGQFAKGRSGNPRGRPERSLGTRQVFQRMLASSVWVTVDGKQVKCSVVEAMALRFRNEVLTGTFNAIINGVSLAQKYSLPDHPRIMNENYGALTTEELNQFATLMVKLGAWPEETLDSRGFSTGPTDSDATTPDNPL